MPAAPTIVEPEKLTGEQLLLADQIYDTIRNTLGADHITFESAVGTITTVMAEVEKLGGVPGPQKKEIVLHIVDRLIDEIPTGHEFKTLLKTTVMFLGGGIIDAIAGASKGLLSINTTPSMLPGLTPAGASGPTPGGASGPTPGGGHYCCCCAIC